MFYSISLCTLILTYFYKNKSTIRENVVWIFCIICHVVFCLFFIIILYYSLFFHPFSLFFKYPSKFYRFIENKEIKKTFIFLISLFFIVICLINLTICSPSLHKRLLYHIVIYAFFTALTTQNHCQYRIYFKFTKQHQRDHKKYDHFHTYILAYKIYSTINEKCRN